MGKKREKGEGNRTQKYQYLYDARQQSRNYVHGVWGEGIIKGVVGGVWGGDLW